MSLIDVFTGGWPTGDSELLRSFGRSALASSIVLGLMAAAVLPTGTPICIVIVRAPAHTKEEMTVLLWRDLHHEI